MKRFLQKNGRAIAVALAFATVAATFVNMRARNLIVSESPWRDVRAYGILPANTAAVNTPLIQSLLTAIVPGTVIFFPAGDYLVDNTITVSAKGYFRIEGAGNGKGAAGVSIRWTGSGDDAATMFDFDQVRFAEIKNIQFMGNNTGSTASADRTNVGVYVHNASRHITWKNCSWYFFSVGLQQGSLTANEGNNDASVFFHLEFGYNGIGVRIAGANAIHNDIYDNFFEYNDVAISVGQNYANGGPTSVTITNADFSHNTTDILGASAFYNLTLIHPRTEAAYQFMSMPGANASLSKIVMINPEINFNSSATGGPGNDTASTPRFLDSGLATLAVTGGVFSVLGGGPMQAYVGGQSAAFVGTDFAWPNAFTPTDNSFSAGKVSLIGCRIWDGVSAYKPMADGERYGQSGLYRFAANDNTPSVLTGSRFLTAAGTVQDITSFDDAYLFQRVTAVCADNLTTFKNSVGATGFFLDGSADWACPSIWANISLIRMENDVWVQDGKPMVR